MAPSLAILESHLQGLFKIWVKAHHDYAHLDRTHEDGGTPEEGPSARGMKTNSNGKICNLKCRRLTKVIHSGKWDPTWLYIYIMVGKHINIKSVYVIFVQDKNVWLCTVWYFVVVCCRLLSKMCRFPVHVWKIHRSIIRSFCCPIHF